MLVEPPGSHVPPRHRLSPIATARLAAAAAALVLALTSRGDVVVVGVALTVAAWRPVAALAVAAAVGASAWRWGSASLEDVAGAQAVLGPAGWVDPPLAAAGSWLGALALVLVAPTMPRVAGWLAAGAAAAVVVAGPGPDDVWIRVAAGVVAALIAGLVAQVTAGWRWVEPLALAAGVAAVALTAPDAPPLATPSAASLGEGLAIAAAAAGVATVAAALRRSRPDRWAARAAS